MNRARDGMHDAHDRVRHRLDLLGMQWRAGHPLDQRPPLVDSNSILILAVTMLRTWP